MYKVISNVPQNIVRLVPANYCKNAIFLKDSMGFVRMIDGKEYFVNRNFNNEF